MIKIKSSKYNKMKKILVIVLLIITLTTALFIWFRADKTTVSFEVEGEEFAKSNLIKKGSKIVAPENPTKDGYVFIGWYSDGEKFDFETTPITNDIKLEAKWAKDKYNVIIDDGTNKITEVVNYNEKVEIPETPTKKGYTFSNWYNGDDVYDFDEPVTSDITLEAKWVKIGYYDYTVEHYLMNADGEYSDDATEIEIFTIKNGNIASPKTNNYIGYKTPRQKSVKINSDDIVIQYYYKLETYDLNLKIDNGIKYVSGNSSYHYNDKVKIDYTLNYGYEFVGFSKNVNNGIYIMPDEDTTIKLTTKPIEYTISYDLNNGTLVEGKTNPSTYTIEDNITLKNPSKTGYTFIGWYDGDTKIESISKGTTGNISLVAEYTANTNTVYKVKHCKMDLDEKYTICEDENLTGTTNTIVIPDVMTYEGFISPSKQELKINDDGSSELVYNYTRNKYTLTIIKDNGIADASASTAYYYDEDVSIIATLKDGYKDLTYDKKITKMPASNIEVKISSTPITYDITYDLKGGLLAKDETNTTTYTIEDVVTLQNPSKTGYTFTGWYDGDTKIESISKGTTGNISLVAKYTANTYNVAFNGNSATSGNMEIQSFTYDREQALTTNAYTKSYNLTYNVDGTDSSKIVNNTFKGWSDSQSGTAIYLDQASVTNLTATSGETVNLYAVWENPTITLSTDVSNKTGYTFAGWSTSENGSIIKDTTYTLTGDTTLYAIWTPISYTISYDLKGGLLAKDETNTTTYTIEDAVTLKNPSKTGYTFTGWYDGDTKVESISAGTTGNISLVAKYTANNYTISYDLNNGSLAENEANATSYTIEDAVTLKNPSKTGYTFIGWYDGDTKVENISIGTTGNISLIAKYTANTYTVSFNGNGATSGSMESQSFTYDKKQALTTNAYTKSYTLTYNVDGTETSKTVNNTFKGWSDSQLGTAIYLDQASVNNLSTTSGETVNLYAVWENPTITLSTDISNKTGYTFAGWSTSKNGSIIKDTTYTLTGDTTLYGVWTVNTYTISYDLNNGSLVEGETNPSTYTIEDNITLKNPIKTGYTFVGWKINGATYSEYTISNATGNISLEAVFTPNLDTQYKVNYYFMDVDGNYCQKPDETLTLSGPTDSYTQSTASNYTGFTTPALNQQVILGDGSTSINYFYIRNAYQLVVTASTGIESVSGSATYYYDKAVKLTATLKDGYENVVWSNGQTGNEITLNMSNNDVNITASASLINYTILYNLNGGTVSDILPTSYTINTTNLSIINPTRVGYTFKGWSLNNNDAVKDLVISNMSGNITLNAIWEINSSTIGFNTHGGSNVNAIVQDYGTTVSAPENPTKTGYTFAGWYTSENYYENELYTFSTMPASSVELHAKWTPISYTVSFDGNGKTSGSMESQSFTYDEEQALTINTYSKTGYTFAGWLTDDVNTTYVNKAIVKNLTSTNDDVITLKASWKANTYTVSFNGNGATSGSMESQSFTYDTEQALTTNAYIKSYTLTYNVDGTKTSETVTYEFKGWSDSQSGTVIYKNQATVNNLTTTNGETVNLYAVWENSATTLKTDVSSKTGYTFAGWSTSENGSVINSTAYTLTGNTTLYAIWTPISYTISYELNNGSLAEGKANATSYTIEDNITLINPSKKGYTFTGWYDGDKKVESISTGTTGNISLVAKYTVNTYTITYDLNNGSLAEGEANATSYTIEDNITLQNPSKKGYTFTGWYNGDKKVESISKGTTGNISLVAKYTANTYAVAFNGNGATSESMESQSFTYDTEQALTTNAYTKSYTLTYNVDGTETSKEVNNTFTGWSDSQSGTVIYDNQAKVNNLTATNGATVNLYAIWEDPTVTLSTDVSNKTGYTFAGWSTSENGSVINSTTYTLTGDTTLYAIWTPISYTITYELNNGSLVDGEVNPSTYTIEDVITLKNPSKTGYTFTGWYSGDTKVESISKGTTENIILVAKYTANTYTVAFNRNGATSGSMGSQSFTYDKEQSLTTNAYTKSYTLTYNVDGTKTSEIVTYEFKGWSDSQSGTVIYDNQAKVKNLTATNGGTINLYAVWDDSAITLKTDVSNKTGYVFYGWSTSKNGDAINSTTYTLTENTTLYAVWSKIIDIDNIIDGLNSSANNTNYEAMRIDKSLKPYDTTNKLTGDVITIGIKYKASGSTVTFSSLNSIDINTYVTAIWNAISNNNVTSITIGSESFNSTNCSSSNDVKTKLYNALATLAGSSTATIDNLIGKSLNITINLNGNKEVLNSDKDIQKTYTVKFMGRADITLLQSNGLGAINGQGTFYGTANGQRIDIKILKPDDKLNIDNLRGTGVKSAMQWFIIEKAGVSSISVINTKITSDEAANFDVDNGGEFVEKAFKLLKDFNSNRKWTELIILYKSTLSEFNGIQASTTINLADNFYLAEDAYREYTLYFST